MATLETGARENPIAAQIKGDIGRVYFKGFFNGFGSGFVLLGSADAFKQGLESGGPLLLGGIVLMGVSRYFGRLEKRLDSAINELTSRQNKKTSYSA